MQTEMFRFENDFFLYGLILIPILVIIYYIIRKYRQNALRNFCDADLINELIPEDTRYKPPLKFFLITFALALMIGGIANPQIGTKLENVKREGVDIIIALDVSNSMRAEDIKPNRLERAKQAVSRLIDSLQNDRIGLIVFAGESFLQMPLTTDFGAAKLFLSNIDCDMIATQGTAIGSAINLAIKSFVEKEKKHKILIIITDGENHEDDAAGIAHEAADNGIIVHTIGMGTIDGGPIPIYSGNTQTGYLKDKDGNIVMTKLDPQMLQNIASEGNGKFIRSAGIDPDLSQLVNEISKVEKKEYSSRLYSDYESRFQYLLGAAFIFLIFEFFLSDRKNKYIASLKLFEEKKK
jgi:Ca-activated chloride channel homolog